MNVVTVPLLLPGHSCEDDYVVIDEPIQGKTRKLCGNQIPKAFNISSNELKIAFKSKERIGRPKPGFVATYTSGTTPGKRCHFCTIIKDLVPFMF